MNKINKVYLFSFLICLIYTYFAFLFNTKLLGVKEILSILFPIILGIIELTKIIKMKENKALKIASWSIIISGIIVLILIISSINDHSNLLGGLVYTIYAVMTGIIGMIIAYVSNIIGFFIKKE